MDKVVHFEIPVDDMARAKKFYSIFGWKLEDMSMPEWEYVAARTVEADENGMPKEHGAISGGLMKRMPFVKNPVVAVNVTSVDESLKKVEAAGGKMVMPKTEIGGMGWYAYATDTEGNVFGLWESVKK